MATSRPSTSTADGRVVGGATVGRSDDLEQVERLVSDKATPARDALAGAALAEL